jgi:hypothetical protein
MTMQEKRAGLESALQDREWIAATAKQLRCGAEQLAAQLAERVQSVVEEPAPLVQAPGDAEVLPEHMEVLRQFGNLPAQADTRASK